MPDISMCLNENCSLKDGCYRFNAKPSEYSQSYELFEERNKEKCFIPLFEKDNTLVNFKVNGQQ